MITYRSAEIEVPKYVSPFREKNEELFRLIFGQGDQGFGVVLPVLALNEQEESREFGGASDLDLILGAIARALDDHGLGVVQQAIEQGQAFPKKQGLHFPSDTAGL